MSPLQIIFFLRIFYLLIIYPKNVSSRLFVRSRIFSLSTLLFTTIFIFSRLFLHRKFFNYTLFLLHNFFNFEVSSLQRFSLQSVYLEYSATIFSMHSIQSCLQHNYFHGFFLTILFSHFWPFFILKFFHSR